tara:strand:- start:7846 stop:8619 length:774 start_codon:yes stop_codon:yes gene_type:complete
MSKGYLIFAQNNGKTDYIEQAELLKASIQKYNDICDVTIISEFETDYAKDSTWKIENRWQAYNLSPYDETIVLDADMLFCRNVDHWWDKFENYDMFFTSDVLTYRQSVVTNTYYRKTFVHNNLPNIYTAFYYFKKTPTSKRVFNVVEDIVNNWQTYYARYLKSTFQTGQSFDLNMALAIKMLGLASETTDDTMVPSFIHFKPKIQDWDRPSDSVTDRIPVYYFKDNLMLDSYMLNDILHYVEPEFVTQEIKEFFNGR